jgi:hypothetical protein
VVTWSELAAQAGDLATLGEERMEEVGVVLVGTVRADGTARISPVEPLLLDGRLYLGMMWRSKKALDLLRDPRVLVHSAVRSRDGADGEFKLRGRVRDIEDTATRERFADAVERKIDWRPPEPYHLFEVDIEDVAYVKFAPDGSMSLRRWPGP